MSHKTELINNNQVKFNVKIAFSQFNTQLFTQF